ncbi:ANTAR domain-containing protein [Actinocatenispora sera]|uniref:ANTAR domain-containing protein n=1 Tax=Actinocatenispora sera TaxID=390989 RepID=UPI001B80122D|nr:ANTAR domain-containing protein [Actinocatenispora sera]
MSRDGAARPAGRPGGAAARQRLVELACEWMPGCDWAATSRQIGSAIGILMSAYTITNEQAFRLLRATSQNLNRKLRDVARDVTDPGELPAQG